MMCSEAASSTKKLLHLTVVGAGPVGIEMAVAAVRAGMRVTLIERGAQIASNIIGPGGWGHVRLFSSNKLNCSSVGLSVLRESGVVLPSLDKFLTGQEYVQQYLEPLIAFLCASKLCTVRCATKVISIGRGSLSKGQSIGISGKRPRTAFRIMVSVGDSEEIVDDIDAVVDATGTYGNHNWVGKGGIPALGERGASIQYTIPNPLSTEGEARYFSDPSGSSTGTSTSTISDPTATATVTAVIGSGASAITAIKSLQSLGQHKRNQSRKMSDGYSTGGVAVVWITRRSGKPYQRVDGDPLQQRDSLYKFGNSLVADGSSSVKKQIDNGFVSFRHVGGVDVLAVRRLGSSSRDTAKQEFELTLQHRVGGRQETVRAHNVLGLVGYRPDTRITEELQIHYCYATQGPMNLAAAMMAASGGGGGDCLKQVAPGAAMLKNPEPGFFILGMKSYGRGSGFLLRIGHEQVQQVLGLLRGMSI